MTTDFDTALQLVAGVRAALTNGVKHYNDAGRLLETETEIIEALIAENGVVLDESERVERVTAEALYEQLKAATPVH